MRSNTQRSLGYHVKKSVGLKLKIMSITCRFHVFDLVLTVDLTNFILACLKISFLREALLFQINLPVITFR